jgi:hypothetical protein
MLTEKIVNTNEYAGCVDLITGVEDFKSQVEYIEDFHCYKLNGKIIPSVTQLLDDGGYENVSKEILEYAREKGSIVHKEIETYLKTSEMGFTAEFYEFLTLYTQNQELFSTKAIFDYKTYNTNLKKNREKCYKQIKMYDKAIEYLTGKGVDNYFMVWLPHNKEGKIFDLREEFENEHNNG